MSLRPREIAFEEVWTKLFDIIKGVITLNRLRRIDKPLWHNTFSDVYMLCVAHPEPHSKQLYEETRRLLELHVIAIYDVRNISSKTNNLNSKVSICFINRL
jgi:cullin 2